MIVGVDVSSKRVDLAWLEDGKPCRWHQELAKGHLIDRLRSIQIRWPGSLSVPGAHTTSSDPPLVYSTGHDVTDIAIEYPFGRGNAIAALMATTGIITHQAPRWARVAWPSAGELRAAIGAKNTKLDANRAIYQLMDDCEPRDFERRFFYGPPHPLNGWNEHETDALVACIGWTRILEQQDAA